MCGSFCAFLLISRIACKFIEVETFIVFHFRWHSYLGRSKMKYFHNMLAKRTGVKSSIQSVERWRYDARAKDFLVRASLFMGQTIDAFQHVLKIDFGCVTSMELLVMCLVFLKIQWPFGIVYIYRNNLLINFKVIRINFIGIMDRHISSRMMYRTVGKYFMWKTQSICFFHWILFFF